MRDKTIYLAGENLANAGNRKDMTDYPRVTDILSIINSEELNYLRGRLGNEGFEEMMNQKGDLGTSTHQDCYLVNRGLAPCPDARTKAMVEAYQRWFVTCVSKVIASEIPLKCDKYKFQTAGVDIICILKGEKTASVLDIKTGVILPKFGLQTAAYKHLAKENGFKTRKRGIVDLWALNKGGMPRVIWQHDFEKDWRHYLYCLDLFRRFSNNH
jgi:hypothetical protein